MRDSVIPTKGKAYKIWNEMLVAMLRIKIALKFLSTSITFIV